MRAHEGPAHVQAGPEPEMWRTPENIRPPSSRSRSHADMARVGARIVKR